VTSGRRGSASTRSRRPVETPATAGLRNFAEKRANLPRAPLPASAPDDVAGAAAFLLSKDAAWITGQTLIIDGGYAIA
jgi:NAD(P)-dependent dehydrogenase (short-subunit alcohol dehydrogenase family)